MKLKRLCVKILAFLIASTSLFEFQAFAQPYLYYTRFVAEPAQMNIYRYNFTTGLEELFSADTARITDIRQDPSELWLYVVYRGEEFEIRDAQNPSRRHILNLRLTSLSDIVYIPRANRFYLSYVDSEDQTKGALIDATTFGITDTIPPISEFSSRAFLSSDQTRIYEQIRDSSSDALYLQSFSLSSYTITSRKKLLDLGPPTNCKLVEDGRNDFALISYGYPSCQHLDNHYIIYDITADTSLTPIPFPHRAKALLSQGGKYLILELVLFEKSSAEKVEYRPGVVYIFEVATSRLTQRLSLSPEGHLMLFDNYPDKFFYYLKGTGPAQSLSVIMSAVIPASLLLDTLISLKHQTRDNNLIGDANFVKELDNGLDNAKKHLAKRDSVNCAKELGVFQDKIMSEYQKKSTLGNKRFVTEEAYKQLYFNAQYIIDRLPKK